MMKKRIQIYIIIVLVIFVNLGLDQFTKQLARDHLEPHKYVRVIGDLFVLTLAKNDGAFLSLGSGFPGIIKLLILYILPIIAVVAMIVYIFVSKRLTWGQSLALATIIGGGLGNLLDRFFRGGWVTDFMNFGIGSVQNGLRTGILNVADLSLTFGVVALLILTYRDEKKLKEKQINTGPNNSGD